MKKTFDDILDIDRQYQTDFTPGPSIASLIAAYMDENFIRVKSNSSGTSYRFYNKLTDEFIPENEFAKAVVPYKKAVNWADKPVVFLNWFFSIHEGRTPLACYDAVVNLPYDVGDNIYNKFTHFNGYNPEVNIDENHVKFFNDFIKDIIANGDNEAYDVVMTFFANMIQQPDKKTNLALAMMGNTGIGKGRLMTLISKIVGDNYFYGAQGISKVVGKFNSQLANSYLIYVNEVEGISHTEYQKLKSFITEDTAELEPKGLATFQLKNRWRFVLDGNDTDKFRSSENERRIYYLKVSDSLKGNTDYWNLFTEHIEDQSFVESIYGHLSTFEYNPKYLYDVPQSNAQKDVVRLSRSPFYDEVNDCLDDPDLVHTKVLRNQSIQFIRSSELIDLIPGLTPQMLPKIMTEISPKNKKVRIKEQGQTIRGYSLLR